MNTADLVTLNDNNTPVTDTLKVAERFGKEHKNVTRAIETIIATLEVTGGDALSFEPISYKDSMNRDQTAYIMDRDAFCMLVFGFTGKEAMKFKMDYIKAFNVMELDLMKRKGGLLDMKDFPNALRTVADQLEGGTPAPDMFSEIRGTKADVIIVDEVAEDIPKPVYKFPASFQSTLSPLGIAPRKIYAYLISIGHLERSEGRGFKILKHEDKWYVDRQGYPFITEEGYEEMKWRLLNRKIPGKFRK